jgi:hypothetical protein
MDIFAKIHRLKLPPGSFVVVGSGPLAALGLRQANDIDLLVSRTVYARLKSAGWKEHIYPSTQDTGLAHGDFEVVTSWHGTKLEDLVDSAVWLDGIAFAHLREVTKWKAKMAREKDLKDLQLIQAYQVLATH